jgi:hypothetical protein
MSAYDDEERRVAAAQEVERVSAAQQAISQENYRVIAEQAIARDIENKKLDYTQAHLDADPVYAGQAIQDTYYRDRFEPPSSPYPIDYHYVEEQSQRTRAEIDDEARNYAQYVTESRRAEADEIQTANDLRKRDDDARLLADTLRAQSEWPRSQEAQPSDDQSRIDPPDTHNEDAALQQQYEQRRQQDDELQRAADACRAQDAENQRADDLRRQEDDDARRIADEFRKQADDVSAVGVDRGTNFEDSSRPDDASQRSEDKIESEREPAEDDRQQAVAESDRLERERQENERQRAAGETDQLERERQENDRQRTAAEDNRQRAVAESERLERERQENDRQRTAAEDNRQRAVAESERLERERQENEQQRTAAEDNRQRAMAENERLELVRSYRDDTAYQFADELLMKERQASSQLGDSPVGSAEICNPEIQDSRRFADALLLKKQQKSSQPGPSLSDSTGSGSTGDSQPKHLFPFRSFALQFPVLDNIEEIGQTAADEFVNRDDLMALWKQGGRSIREAGSEFHALAKKAALAYTHVLPGWRITAEEDIKDPETGQKTRPDILARGPDGTLVELDWKPRTDSAIDSTPRMYRRKIIVENVERKGGAPPVRAEDHYASYLQVSRHWEELVKNALARKESAIQLPR